MIKIIARYIHMVINKHCYIAILFGWLYTGFGQFYNGQYLKGLLFVIFNTFNNQYGHLNQAMMYSFTGNIESAKQILNYQWILNYPAYFAYAQWDAYKFGFIRDNSVKPPISHAFPFILAAMLSTVGIIYGSYSIDPIFVGLGGFLLGMVIGAIIIKISEKYR
ncbi:hypothetical protein [Scopulibacillus cellulosilyticus]|uniref:Uncharacterized protein n=1 Tax=Scopulibacillus cellulosilyticus TaxID=2665665 RepID=A0ABW2PPY2_9BACL